MPAENESLLLKRPPAGRVFLIGTSALAFALLALPPLVLAVRGIATRGWAGLPSSNIVFDAALLSFLTTAITAVNTLLLGTPLAYVLARRRFPGRRVVNLFIELPVVLPPAVAGLALLLTFGRRGPFGPALLEAGITLPFSTVAVVIAQTFIAAPFYIRSAQVGFASVSRDVEEAARVDGAEGFSLFRNITLPLTRHMLAAGLALSWARALGEFGATILFAGNLQGRTQTMPLLVYSVFERDINAAIWTGLILVALALLALILSQWLLRQQDDIA